MTSADRDALFALYEETIVSVDHPDSGWSDAALLVAERGQPAIVITAWNPGFARPSREENEAANLRLRERLLGHIAWPADGRSPDGTFNEPGFLVWGMSVDVALDVAREFGQFAIFAFDGAGNRRVVPCD